MPSHPLTKFEITLYVREASPKDVNNNNVTYFDSFGVEYIPK